MPGMAEVGTDWRLIDGVVTAWFDAPSLIEDAALAGRIIELPPGIGQANLGEGYGPFGVRHADSDGNEVDLVPASALDDRSGTAENIRAMTLFGGAVDSLAPRIWP